MDETARANFHNNAGAALQDADRLEDAAAGHPDPALASYQRALSLAPGRAATHANLATLLERYGRFEEAAAWYAGALSIEESDEYRARFARCLRQATFTRGDAAVKHF